MSTHQQRPRTPHDRPAAVSAPNQDTQLEQGNLVVVQERVLAEISHELGNFFHKLYYWSDYIKGDAEGAKKFDTTAGHMLERTISNLEDFLKVALDYFHPIKLNFTKIAVAELLDAFMTHLGAHLNGNEVHVNRDEIEQPATILVDPARISQSFRIALHHVHEDLKSGGTLSVSLGKTTRREFPGLEISLMVTPKVAPSPLFRTAEAGVEWAVAQKLIEMHGGEIVEELDNHGRKIVLIFLPLYG